MEYGQAQITAFLARYPILLFSVLICFYASYSMSISFPHTSPPRPLDFSALFFACLPFVRLHVLRSWRFAADR
jgi:hypothetical protein